MSRLTWNKVLVATNGDTYDVPKWIGAAAETSNVVIPVTSQAERDALAGAYGATTESGNPMIPLGAVVTRIDLPGSPLERWDGANWRRDLQMEIKAATPTNPQIKVGVVTANTDANGACAFVYDQPFPSATYMATATQAKAPGIGAVTIQFDEALSNKTRAAFFVYDMAGVLIPNLVGLRACYTAFGS